MASKRALFRDLSEDLNRNCTRTTNIECHLLGKSWNKDCFYLDEDGKSFYIKTNGCEDNWGTQCDGCIKVLDYYEEKFDEIFGEDKSQEILEEIRRLNEKIDELKKENSRILDLLSSLIK